MVEGLGTVDCAYFLTFAVGIVWAIFVLFAGDAGHSDTPDVHTGDIAFGHAASFDAGSVEVSPISPITISTFITTFGGIGIITRQAFDLPVSISLLVAVASGLLCAGLMFLFYSKLLIGSQGSSEVRVHDLAGSIAEVTVPISAQSMGEIALVARGGRVTYPARSTAGIAIAKGTPVTIDRMVGAQALVSPADPDSEPTARSV